MVAVEIYDICLGSANVGERVYESVCSDSSGKGRSARHAKSGGIIAIDGIDSMYNTYSPERKTCEEDLCIVSVSSPSSGVRHEGSEDVIAPL